MADYARNKKFFSAGTLLMLGVAAWMSTSLIWLAPVPEPWRAPLTLALTLFALCVTSLRVLVTRKPDLPFAFVRIGGFVSASFMTLSWLVLLRDILLGGAALASLAVPSLNGAKQTLFSALFSLPFELALVVSGFAIAAAGMLRALRTPEVRRITVAVPGLPQELEGLRLVQMSDLHVGACFGKSWLEEVVRTCNGLDADFVFLTGDMADGSPERIEEHLRPLSGLTARYGVLAVPGNHDYYSGLPAWVEKWRAWGISVLLNAHRDFTADGRLVRVAGVNDSCASLDASLPPEMGPPDIRRALSTPQREGNSGPAPAPPHADLSILLAHRPGNAREHAALGVDLQISGHTHGGQFFFLFPLVTHMNKGFRAGLYRVGRMPLYVSSGTGMWGYAPMRCGSRSEIALLTLARAD